MPIDKQVVTTTGTKTRQLTRYFVISAVATSAVSIAVAAILYFSLQPPETNVAPDEVHWTITGPTSVTIDWRGTGTPVQYGLTTSYGQSTSGTATSPAPISSSGSFWEAKIIGLLANTTYHYLVAGGADHTFKTAATATLGTSFTVYVEGDIGDSTTYNPRVAAVQTLVANAHPNFVLGVGDLTYANDHGQSSADQHFNDVMSWSLDAAYMPAWGNHEWDKTGHCNTSPACTTNTNTATACNLQSDCITSGQTCCTPLGVPEDARSGDDLRNYKGRFDLPNPQTSPGSPALGGSGKDWYWFDYGNTRFISYPEPYSGAVADWKCKMSNQVAGCTSSPVGFMDQAQSDTNISFIVTFGHRPAYSSGHHPGESGIKTAIDALGITHSKFVLNLNGHSHDYERTNPQSGVTHITVGTGGSTLEEDGTCLWLGGCPPPAFTAYRAMHHGVLKLAFTQNSITGTFVCGPAGDSGSNKNDVTCTSGDPLDTFAIPPSGGPDADPPTNVGNLTPADGATVSTTTPTLTATTASDATPPISYKFELYNGVVCTGLPLQIRDYLDGATTWSITTPLSTTGTYAWHNLAKDSDVGSPRISTSPCTTFAVDTVPPTGTANFSPPNDSTVPSTTPTLTAAQASDVTLPISYSFELFNGSTCSNPTIQTSPFSTSLTWVPTALTNSTTYSWHVKAEDAATPPNVSTALCWVFTTPAAASVSTILSDTFESNPIGGSAAGWTTLGTGSWSVTSDGTKVYKQATTSGDAWSTAGLPTWSNYSVQAKVKSLSLGSGGFVGLYGRWQDSSHFYYVRMTSSTVCSGSCYTLELKKKNGSSSAIALSSLSFDFVPSIWHTVKLELMNSDLKVYVDGVLKMSASDTTFTSGIFGLGMYNATAEYDDVIVTKPSSSGGGGGNRRIPTE